MGGLQIEKKRMRKKRKRRKEEGWMGRLFLHTIQRESKKYGLRAGEDLLPTKEKIKRIEEQLRELVRDIEKERNTLDAMERMVLVYNTEATQRQVTEKVNEARQKIADLNKTKTELFDLLANLERELRQQE